MAWREPYWFRPADHRYCIRSNAEYGWTTGVAEDGRQVLHSAKYRLAFNADGRLLGPIGAEPVVHDAPIHVLRFWAPDLWTGVEDLPEALADFFLAPDDFCQDPNDVESWLQHGMFVFNSGWSDYYVSRDGRVETS